VPKPVPFRTMPDRTTSGIHPGVRIPCAKRLDCASEKAGCPLAAKDRRYQAAGGGFDFQGGMAQVR